jgi:hypothetical protein
MPAMRRLAAVIAVSVLVGSTALPVLAALCCDSAPSHTCCTRGEEAGAAALERAPCCKAAVAVKGAAREQATPRATGGSLIAIPAAAPLLSQPAVLTADARRPACTQSGASPALGPPLHLRI